MESETLRRQMLALIDAMNEALDKHRWRRMPGLHQQLMKCFKEYEAVETSADALREMKAQLHTAYAHLIDRQNQRAEILKVRMDNLQRNKEGVLAYSMVNLFSEPS